MKLVSMTQQGICLLAACLLAGCAPAQVKDVMANQSGYLDANFSPDQLPSSVRDAVARADAGPLGFQKMALRLDWTMNADDKDKIFHVGQKLTLTNAGGSFVQSIAEDSRNGIPVDQQDSLSYRGLIPLRTQKFSMTASHGAFAIVMHSIEHFDPITSGAADLQYVYTTGTSAQLMNFLEARISCAIGKPYPAAQLFATFAGEARNVECTQYNANGAVARKDGYAYLQRYGIAIHLRAELSAGRLEAKVVAANIQ